MSIKVDFTNHGFFEVGSTFYKFIGGTRYRVVFVTDNLFLQEATPDFLLLEDGISKLALEA